MIEKYVGRGIEGQVETVIIRKHWIIQKVFTEGEWRITTTVPNTFNRGDMESAEREALQVFVDEIEAERSK